MGWAEATITALYILVVYVLGTYATYMVSTLAFSELMPWIGIINIILWILIVSLLLGYINKAVNK